MVGEHADRRVVGRVLAPPASPALVPVSAAGSEHVASHYVGADPGDQAGHDLGVRAILAALTPRLLVPAPGGENPFMGAQAALAERVLRALAGAGDQAVDR